MTPCAGLANTPGDLCSFLAGVPSVCPSPHLLTSSHFRLPCSITPHKRRSVDRSEVDLDDRRMTGRNPGQPVSQCKLRLALLEFKRTYNEQWMLEKYHYRSPAQVRRDLVGLDAAA